MGDPSISKDELKETLKSRVKGGLASAVDAKDTVLHAEHSAHSKDKAKEYVHKAKHYGAFAEDYLGFEDPNKELRKAVKAKEKAAKKARKAKKKKTGKKGEDLFDPENLAKYKRELEEKRKAAAAAEAGGHSDESHSQSDEEHQHGEREPDGGEHDQHLNLALAERTGEKTPAGGSSEAGSPDKSAVTSPKEDKEDWRKFLDLTSGVDSLIQKSKQELEEIKTESYYQPKQFRPQDHTKEAIRKKKQKQKKKWVDLDSASFDDYDGEIVDEQQRVKEILGEDEEEDDDSDEEGAEKEADGERLDGETDGNQDEKSDHEKEESKSPELVKEPSIEEYVDPDEDDAIFNTDFVTDITTGKVQLAVIPDDPIFDDGDDDPFDTAVANKVVKKVEEEKRKEQVKLKFTGLSAVADVLSGKSEKLDKTAVEHAVRRKRRRANRINLIGEDGQELTAVEDIDDSIAGKPAAAEEKTPTADILGGLDVPEGDLLATTPTAVTPVAASEGSGQKEGEKKKGLDLSEFEEIAASEPAGLTSNIAILAGEFDKPAEEEEDDFDAAFDALAQEAVTKSKLDEFEKQFENEDDIFDTSNADKVLKLASLLDKVEEPKPEEEAEEEIDENQFEDPFDTSAYDKITGEVETEIDFDSIAHRDAADDTSAPNRAPEVVIKDAGASAFDAPSAVARDLPSEGWAAFDGNKPKRPPPPARPPRPTRNNLDPSASPAVVVKAPSTESIKSWNVSVADTLIKKSEIEAQDSLIEQEEEEFDPFDTRDFEQSDKKKDEEEDIDDPFDTTAVNDIVEQVEEAKRQEELAKQPVDLLGGGDGTDVDGDTLQPVSKDLTDPEADPFDTEFAADVLPNRGDPFNTSHIKGELGKAEIRALEDELLAEPEFDPRTADGTAVPKKSIPGVAGRARPKGAAGELAVKVPSQEEEEEDPFDTSVVDKVIPVRRAEKRSEISVEDEEFDPTAAFKKTKELSIQEEADPFDTSVAINALPEEERKAALEKKRIEAEQAAAAKAAAAAAAAKKAQEPSPDISDDDFDPRAFE